MKNRRRETERHVREGMMDEKNFDHPCKKRPNKMEIPYKAEQRRRKRKGAMKKEKWRQGDINVYQYKKIPYHRGTKKKTKGKNG